MSKNSALKILGSYVQEKKSELYTTDVKGFGVIRISPEPSPYRISLYCANDIARALGYKEPAKAVTKICEYDEKRVIYTKHGMQEMKFIRADEVKKLIRHSKLAQIQKDELIENIDSVEYALTISLAWK